MPHITLPDQLPGITSGFAFRPETAKPMRELAEILPRDPSSLTSGERELIATFVSTRHDCFFCQASHRAAAAHHLDQNYQLVDAVRFDYENAPVSGKLKALLGIAGKVQQEGATDLEIHDTVLIAAACCMYNRYVDGLATYTPTDLNLYDQNGSSDGSFRICPARGSTGSGLVIFRQRIKFPAVQNSDSIGPLGDWIFQDSGHGFHVARAELHRGIDISSSETSLEIRRRALYLICVTLCRLIILRDRTAN